MSNKKDSKLDPNKVFDPDKIRLNLLVSSLYLTTFEILKLAIVEGVKDFLVFETEITNEQERLILEIGQEDEVARIRKRYTEQVERYEKEVGVKFKESDRHGFIPSCEWLQIYGGLSEKDIEEIKAIRNHRNKIAHELPYLLVSKGFDVNLNHFQRMRRLLHKVDVFWARNDILLDPATSEEIDTSEVADEEIYSSREAILDLITNTVANYLNHVN